MTTFTLSPLSASTDYRGIKVAATSLAAGTTIHTDASGAVLPDLLKLVAYNSDTVARPLKLGVGGTTSPDDVLAFVLLPGETRVLCDQLPIRNSLVVKAASETMTWIDGVSYTGAANVIAISGRCQRVS